MNYSFKTDDLELFQKMIYAAVTSGLCFEAREGKNCYIIEYTGGY